MIFRLRHCAIAAAVLGFAAGFSPAATPPSSSAKKAAPEINACEFLTSSEVSEVLTATVREGQRSDDGQTSIGSYSSTCFWRVASASDSAPQADPKRPLYAIVNMMSWPPGSGMSGRFLEDFRNAEKHELIPGKTVPLQIGDEALSWGDGVAVRKGDLSFGVSVALKPGDHSISGPMQEKLARKIVEHLERGVRRTRSASTDV